MLGRLGIHRFTPLNTYGLYSHGRLGIHRFTRALILQPSRLLAVIAGSAAKSVSDPTPHNGLIPSAAAGTREARSWSPTSCLSVEPAYNPSRSKPSETSYFGYVSSTKKSGIRRHTYFFFASRTYLTTRTCRPFLSLAVRLLSARLPTCPNRDRPAPTPCLRRHALSTTRP